MPARVCAFDYCLNMPVNIFSTLLLDNSLTNLFFNNIKCSGELDYEYISKSRTWVGNVHVFTCLCLLVVTVSINTAADE